MEIADVSTYKPNDIIRELMRTQKSPEQLIPDDIEPSILKQYADLASQAYITAQASVTRIRPFMGRILLIYKRRSELYKDLHYQTFDQWMTDGVMTYYKIARSDAYALINIAEQLGDLPAQKLAELGMNKLKTLSNILKEQNKGVTVEMKLENRDKWVAIAESGSEKDLAALAVARNVVDEGALVPRVPLVFSVTPQIKERAEQFKANEQIRQFITQRVGMFDDSIFLEALISECEPEWLGQMEDAIRATAPQEA